MKNTCLIFISLTLVLCVLAGGCAQPSAPPPVIPTTVVPVTTIQPTPSATQQQTCSLEPGPTQAVPDYESVSVTVNRNSITQNPTISVIFNGGQGFGMVQRMHAQVIRSDCVTEEGARDYPGMGDTVTLMGTTLTDRVIVVMTMTSGDQYTIIDQMYPFPPQMQ